MDDRINKNYFGSWKATEKIGEGSFGSVYKLERNEFGRTYTSALKVINIPQSESEIRSFIAEGYSDKNIESYYRDVVGDFVDEIELMTKLKGNTNIVSYEDHLVVESENQCKWEVQIRMEFLTPLYEYFQKKEVTLNDILKLGTDICSALELCQKFDIVHRDIKPENIFVSPAGDYKLGDFGIARKLEETMGGLSKKGTFYYMAPEVYKGEEYGKNVDIYSLGIVLYRLLNDNRLPFWPEDKEMATYKERELALSKRLSGSSMPKPLNATDRLAEIILKACAYAPQDRYSSPSQFKEELMAVARDMTKKAAEVPSEDKPEPATGKALKRHSEEIDLVPDETVNISQVFSVECSDDSATLGVFDYEIPKTAGEKINNAVNKASAGENFEIIREKEPVQEPKHFNVPDEKIKAAEPVPYNMPQNMWPNQVAGAPEFRRPYEYSPPAVENKISSGEKDKRKKTVIAVIASVVAFVVLVVAVLFSFKLLGINVITEASNPTTQSTKPSNKPEKPDLKKITFEDDYGNIFTFDADDTFNEIAEKYRIDDEWRVFYDDDGDGSMGWSNDYDDPDGVLMSRFDAGPEEDFVAIGRIYLGDAELMFELNVHSLRNDGKILSDYNIAGALNLFPSNISYTLNGISLSSTKEDVKVLWGTPDEEYDEYNWYYDIPVNSKKTIRYFVFFDDNNNVTDISLYI